MYVAPGGEPQPAPLFLHRKQHLLPHPLGCQQLLLSLHLACCEQESGEPPAGKPGAWLPHALLGQLKHAQHEA